MVKNMTQNRLLPGLLEIQAKAEQKFNNSSWPSTKEEEWRRTDLKKIGIETYAEREQTPSVKTLSVIKEIDYSDYALKVRIDCSGTAEAVVSTEAAEKGVSLFLLSDKDASFNEIIEWSFGKMDNKTGYWNFTRLSGSILLNIPPHVTITKPVIFEYSYKLSHSLSLPGLFIKAGEYSKAEVIHKITAEGTDLCIAGTAALFVKNNAEIKTAFISDISESSLLFIHRNILLEKGSNFLDFQNYNGSSLSKGRTEVILDGENIKANLYGAFIAEKEEHIDIKTVQNHRSTGGKSQTLLKSVVKDRGRTIFQGLIEVEEEGALTDAYLMNSNIVLNDTARADSIPALKIRNNDVKCSHGSATGKIDPHQVFYLTSRGFSKEKAKSFILEGFFNQVYDKLPESFTSVSKPILEKKLISLTEQEG